MPEVSLSQSIDNGCATFTINNLLIDNEGAIDESNFKIYDIFVETGDGNFFSFFTREEDVEDGAVTYNSRFTYKFQHPGSYKPVANMKAIYSDDGDPKYPSGDTIITGNVLNNPCPQIVENKIMLPEIKTGPRVARSHMPKFGEQNVYIINFERIINNPDYQDVVVFFYNQTGKQVNGTSYKQWNPIRNLDEFNLPEISRIAPETTRIAAGTVADFVSGNTVTALQNTDPNVIQQLNETLEEYTHYVAFEIDDRIESKQFKNVFVSLTGHNELQTALTISPDAKPETLNVSAIHFYRPRQTPNNQPTLYVTSVFKTSNDALTRFHDPNYIEIDPQSVEAIKIQDETYTYKVFCSNDGSDSASFVGIKAYVDFGFFDIQSIADIQVIDSSMPLTSEPQVKSNYIGFTWSGIALMGSNGADDVPQSQLWIRFRLRPKANPASRTMVTAFAEIIMGVGTILDTTRTPKRALMKVIGANPNQRPTGPDKPDTPDKPTPAPGQNQGCSNLGCSLFLVTGILSLFWWMV